VFLYQADDLALAYVFWGLSGITLLWMAFFSRGHAPWR
jgi:hypothetical protein